MTIERAIEILDPKHREHYDSIETVIETVNEACRIGMKALRFMADLTRCKDCKFRGSEDCAMQYECDCGAQHSWNADDDFCSWGERKET